MANNGVANACKSYNVADWGSGYFSIDDSGDLCVHPVASSQHVSLPRLVEEIKDKGMQLPVLVRFTDILTHRVNRICHAFQKAVNERRYKGQYQVVYPIKVNQQNSVVSELISHKDNLVGLEAGSKSELLAILGARSTPIRIICNGYKDSEFLRLATIGKQMGHDVCIVLEKLSELKTFLANIDEQSALPTLGIRIKLHSAAKGKWQNTGGEKGKFGFNANQLLQAIDMLRQHEKLDLLTLVHFHIGSQVANIRDIHQAMQECARHYAELRQIGVNISCVDVGGGLGVDYEGSRSRSACSMNYTIEEYAKNVVFALADICEKHGLPHPNIVSESGRALTAHHAVLITNVIEKESIPVLRQLDQPTQDAPIPLQELWRSLQNINERNVVEAYHDAQHYFADAHGLYVSGAISIRQWSQIEQVYFALLKQVHSTLDQTSRFHREIADRLNEKLADKLFCNFSLFQSIPDVWGIDQLFPIMPLSNMNKPLTMRATIQDITCDSDGQVRQYVDGLGIESSLPLPPYDEASPYYLGIFMVGAYQEILGDLHNLFGDTDSVHVKLDSANDIRISQVIKGETTNDVLKTVHFNEAELALNYRTLLQANADLSVQLQEELMNELLQGVRGYTYFED